MANYANLKTAIQQYIKQNGNEEITGAILQTTLLSMVDSLASGYLFKGIARPLFAPATTDGPTFYIALEAGSYINFALTELGATAILREGYLGIFKTSGGTSNWTFTEVAISIKDGIVTTTKIANGAVTTEKIANGSITNDKISDIAVSTQKIAPNAVTYNKIADGAVGTNKIANGAVDTAKIAEHTIRWENMDQGAVDEDILQDDAVTERKIKDGAVTEYKLGDNSVSIRSIKDGAVTTNKLYNGAVTGEKIANETITGAKLADGTITGEKIANGAIDNEKIADSGIRTENLENESITTNKIEDGAVTTGKIANKAVTKGKLGDDVVAILDELDNKANIDGSYESMSVGMAKNVEATSEISGTSLYRPTAGNADIADGVARVLKIGGKANAWNQLYNSAVPTAINNHKYFCREYNSGVERSEIVLAANLANWFTDGSVNRNVIDLTLMFGAGNEPSSVAEFKTWLQNNIGLQTYYPYNPGKLLAAKLLGLRTVWLNQWDEEWEVGGINDTTGQNAHNASIFRSKNYIPVVGGVTYFMSRDYKVCCIYDANKNFIGQMPWRYSHIGGAYLWDVPREARYARFSSTKTYGATYNHDICINLHYINGRDGEYEPYVEHEYNFDTSKVYGKLNGEGNLVQVFPNGMRSAGTITDILSIKERYAVVKVGNVDFSQVVVDLWNGVFRTVVTGKAITQRNIICSHYAKSGVDYDITPDKSITGGGSNTLIFIKDTSYSTAADFVAAMIEKNAQINFELAESLVYTDLVYRDNDVDTPINALNILVSNYGTEEQIVESPTNGEPNSCAATLDILYGVNAADFMDAANNGAFVSKASLDALCNTLGSTLGGTLTSTWNSAEGHYDFTFTPATNQIENPENNE